MNNPVIGIVIPVYGCKTQLLELYLRLKTVISSITENFEIIMVNDNCPQESWNIITQICEKDTKVKGINLSRNFGQHYAITAGLEHTKSDWVVVMDCDMQDQPEEIIKLYNKAIEGYDVVLGRRHERKDIWLKKLLSKVFYKLLSYLTDTKQDSTIGNFGIYNSKVIKAVSSMRDNLRYFPTMVRWVGFNQTTVDIEHAERKDGKSSYSFRKLLNLSLDVMIAFSDKPLRLVVKLGIGISFMSILFTIYNLVKFWMGDIKVSGWSSLIISIWFLSGIIILILGIVGLYIGKTFEKVKDRPFYIVKDYLNFNE
jgi:polyisoprenyl-phosphate glycosyltransferase